MFEKDPSGPSGCSTRNGGKVCQPLSDISRESLFLAVGSIASSGFTDDKAASGVSARRAFLVNRQISRINPSRQAISLR